MRDAIDLDQVLARVNDPWSPLTVTTLNDYDVRLAKAHGDFSWHSHPDTDELFLVLAGRLTIRLEDREVELAPGQLFVVPAGRRHQPYSANGASVLLIEPSDTVNTGDTPSNLTAPRTLLDPERP